MAKPNLRLQIRFDFDLHAPEGLLAIEHGELCRKLSVLLGAAVAQGMPTVTAKQLGRAGISMLAHHHHVDVVTLGGTQIPASAVLDAAPHLTDEEAAQVARRAAAKAPTEPEALSRHLRRQALALVNEYRLVPCTISGLLPSGSSTQLGGELNLTNGHIFLAEAHKQTRLAQRQPALQVRIDGTPVTLAAELSGQTLTGPVLDVAVSTMAPHRAELIARWQSSHGARPTAATPAA
jgi:hypothetical protein